MKNKRKLWLMLIPLVLVITVMMLPDYTRRALIYMHADVDDYLIFSNDTVRATRQARLWVENPSGHVSFGSELADSVLSFQPLAMLIALDDTLLFEEYYNGHTATSISNTFSVTKSIVSLLAGIALREGSIRSIDDKVSKYLPDFTATSPGRPLTIRHLLEMSTGLDYQEVYTSPFGTTTRSYYGSDIDRQMLGLNFREEPGMVYDYVGAGTQLLAMVLEQATGKPMATLAEEKLWGPLQAENDALWSKDRKDGMVKAFCCFTATARDLARLGRLVCNGGVWNGDTLISREFYDKILSPSLHLTHNAEAVDFYSLQWWLAEWEGYRIVYARGIRGQYIITIPELNLVMVRLGNIRSTVYQGEHPSDLFLYVRMALMAVDQHRTRQLL
jgi:CubicO group peptidase (beta-lactamase class C family)